MFKKCLSGKYSSSFRGVFASYFLLFSLTALAQKDLPNPPADLQSIPAGSFVIPMDTIYQSIVPVGQAPFNLKAYGLVNEFLQNGIPVKWAIRAAKLKDEIDFTAVAERYAPGYIAPSSIDFRAGPFIVPDTTLPCGLSTTQIISSYGNNVAVYKLTANATVDVRYTLTHRPKIAVFNNGGNEIIHTKYLDAAGIGNYEIMDAANISSLINCFTFASEPHADSIQVNMTVVNAVKNFVMNGGNFLAECHAIDAYEDQGFYHTTAGIDVINTNISNHLYPNADLAFSQMHGTLQENERGSIGNWTLSAGSSWLPYFYRSVTSNLGDTVVAVGAHLIAPSAPGGNVYYLGGHDYTKLGNVKTVADLTILARVNGLRLYLNAIFVPSGNTDGAWANAGVPNDTIGCTGNVTLGCAPTGPPGSTFEWTPSAGLSCTGCPNPIASPTVTTTYTIEVTNGCTAIDTVRIVVTPLPIAKYTNNSVCHGISTTFTDQSISATFWEWNFGDPASGINNTSSIQNPSHTFSTAGSYTVTLISGIEFSCRDTTIQVVVVNPLPVVSLNSATICAGEVATLTASGATSYSWSTGATIDSITGSPASTASYTVTGVSAFGCIGTAVGSIVVNPLPVVTVSSATNPSANSATVCAGQTATITASGANSYSWSTGASTNSITLAPAATATYTVIGSTLGCLASATTSIRVNPLPVVTLNSATVCAGQAATLTASGASSYSWSTGASTNSITLAPAATTPYTVTGSTLGCLASATTSIRVNPLPVLTLNSATVCAGQAATLTASGASSYSWSTGASTNSITLAPASTTSYTVTGSTLGCLGTATKSIRVNPLPVVTVNSATVCAGQAATLTASGASSYSWSTGATTNSITLAPASTTPYTVTGSTLGCLASATTSIRVNPLPVVTVNSATVCVGQAATLTATGASSYFWSTGASTNSITLAPASTTSYTVTGSTLGCLASATTSIRVNPLPVVTVNSATVCAGQSATLTASGASSYSWSTSATTNSITLAPASTTPYTVTGSTLGCLASATTSIRVNPLPVLTVNSPTICAGQSATLTAGGASSYSWSTGAATNSITLAPASTTSYTVTGSTLGCLTTATTSIRVNPLPVVTVNSATVCAGQAAILTASGASSYSWSTGASTNSITLAPASTTSYTVTGSTLGCIATATKSIRVNPLPVVTLNSATVCAGQAATLTASGASSYSWSTGASTNSITLAPASTTPYTVTGSTLGCIATATKNIRVNPLPEVTVNSATVCDGQAATLTASGASSYSWSTGASTNSITLAPAATTSYTVTGSTLGCLATATTSIRVNPLPVVTLNSATVCAGQAATLTASGASSYSWSTGASTNSITLAPASTTSYTVTGSTLGCLGTATKSIRVNPLPVLTVNSPTICAGQSATLTASGASSYSWSTGAATNSITLAPTATTPYTVTGSTLGCLASSTTSIRVNPLPVVTVNSPTVCAGQSVTVTASGASSYSWSIGAAVNPITATPASTTSYTVTGSTLGCLATAIANIRVNPLPVVTVNSATVCDGQAATLTASGASSYSWSTGAATNSITLAPASTTSYAVTGSTLGCLATATGSIGIVYAPVVIVSEDTICAGENATLTAFGASGYSWSTGSTANPITVTPTSTSTYSVSGAGCPNTTTGTVTVNPLPVVTINTAAICEGEIASLTASGANSYSWSTGATTNPIMISPGSTASYTVTGSTLGCLGSAITSVVVTPLQDPTFTYNPSTICKTGSTDPSPVITGEMGGTFTSTPSGLVVDPLSGLINIAASNLGTYIITYTTNGPCPASSAFSITITDMPLATFSYGVYCQDVMNPAPASPPGASAGIFSAAPGLVFVNPVVTPGAVDLLASTPGTYTVTNTIAASGSCPAAIASSTITIKAVPVTTVNDQTICAGETTTITAGGADSYLWSDGSGAGSLTASPQKTASYTVTGTTNGCSSSAVGSITVNPIPVLTVNSITICEGEVVTLTASGADTYFWAPSGTSNNSLEVSPASDASFTVTGSSLGCTQTAVSTVIVHPMPVLTVSSFTICFGETITLTANGADTYSWVPGGASDNSITVSPSSTITYSVTGNSLGCIQTATASITVIPLPVAEFNPIPNPTTMLEPVINFDNQSSPDVVYWFWDFGDGDTLAPDTPSPIHTYPEKDAEYLATLVVRNSLCYDTVSHKIIISPEYAFFIPNCFTPNGDGINDGFNGKGIGIIKYHLMIFDRWGNFIWETNSLDEYWTGRANEDADMDTFYIPRGKGISQQDTYVWKVDLTDVFHRDHKFIGIVSIVR